MSDDGSEPGAQRGGTAVRTRRARLAGHRLAGTGCRPGGPAGGESDEDSDSTVDAQGADTRTHPTCQPGPSRPGRRFPPDGEPMTMSPGDPGPTDPEQRARRPALRGPPRVRGRRRRGGAEQGRRNVGGATGPVESAETKAPEPADTARGAVASPADEQPAAETPSPAAPRGRPRSARRTSPEPAAARTGRDQDGQHLDDDSRGG